MLLAAAGLVTAVLGATDVDAESLAEVDSGAAEESAADDDEAAGCPGAGAVDDWAAPLAAADADADGVARA